MPPQFTEPWGPTTPTLPTHLHKSLNGNSTSQIEILEDHLPEEEEAAHHHMSQDHPQVEVVEAEVEVAVAAAVEEEHFHFPDTHLPTLLKSF